MQTADQEKLECRGEKVVLYGERNYIGPPAIDVFIVGPYSAVKTTHGESDVLKRFIGCEDQIDAILIEDARLALCEILFLRPLAIICRLDAQFSDVIRKMLLKLAEVRQYGFPSTLNHAYAP